MFIMAKAQRPKKETDAVSAFELLKAFIEKGMGHGLVVTESEKADIESALSVVEEKVNE
jgi:hypothetical protein